jgi:hypothetical protein
MRQKKPIFSGRCRAGRDRHPSFVRPAAPPEEARCAPSSIEGLQAKPAKFSGCRIKHRPLTGYSKGL